MEKTILNVEIKQENIFFWKPQKWNKKSLHPIFPMNSR